MNQSNSNTLLSVQDRFGLKVAARLSESTDTLPHDIVERLRAARVQALGVHKQPKTMTASAIQSNGMSATLSFGDEEAGFWRRAASLIPVLALIVGLVGVNIVDNDNRAKELAEIDAAILTDDLPPAAYTDPGFAQFLLNIGRDQAQ
jgi:Protein of unknown function (DUF3619)